MRYFLKVYRFINLLSIDVAIGSVCCSLFFSKLFKVSVLPYGFISLGLTVWIIYTVDHLLDAKKMQASATTNRHRFHQQHFQLLLSLVIVATGINSILLLFIRKPVLITGIVLVILVILYLLIQHSLKFLKEIFVAVVYTAGVILPAASNTQMGWKDWPCIS